MIITSSSLQLIVILSADQHIASIASLEQIVSNSAQQFIITSQSDNPIISSATLDQVGERVTHQNICQSPPLEGPSIDLLDIQSLSCSGSILE